MNEHHPSKTIAGSPIEQWLADNAEAINAAIEREYAAGTVVLNFKAEAPGRLRWFTQTHAAN